MEKWIHYFYIKKKVLKLFSKKGIIKENVVCCSRTSATRDPGSLSEAESDEENEEGDYTVYECPGLASVSFFPAINYI